MDDAPEFQKLRQHMKTYDPAVPLGPRDLLFIEQADGPPRLYVGGFEYTYTLTPTPDGLPTLTLHPHQRMEG